jgi:hypothetical protein
MVSHPWLTLKEAFQDDELDVKKPLLLSTPRAAPQFVMLLCKQSGNGSKVFDDVIETKTWNTSLEDPTWIGITDQFPSFPLHDSLPDMARGCGDAVDLEISVWVGHGAGDILSAKASHSKQFPKLITKMS